MHQCAQCGESLPKPRISLNFPSLHSRLRSELGPASVQPEEVASILKSVELDLEDLDAEIARLELQILFLNTLKERHREYGNQFKTLLSPIRRLPDELLCEVFDWCCGMNCFFVTELPVSTAFTFKSAPAMALSSVCSRWRRIALAMPSIWSRIALSWGVRTSSEGPWGNENTFPLFLSLARSLSRPLTIELSAIYRGLGPSVGNDGHLHPIIAKLTEQVHRWQKFTLVESGFCMLKDLFIDSSQFPILEDIELHEDKEGGSTVDFLAGKAPNLKKLTWDGRPPLPVSISAEIFPQIVHIEFSLEPALLELLEANPNLISLTIEGRDNLWSEREYIARPRTFPRMETLSVDSVQDLECDYPQSSVFSVMHCPSLKSLHLSSLLDYSWGGFNVFMAFVRRSSFPLTTLSMQNIPLSDFNLVYLLNHVPTLISLSVDDSTDHGTRNSDRANPLTERFINSLHAYQTSSLRSHSSPIVPRLRSLTLNCGASEFNDSAVTDMVRSRWFPSTLSSALSKTEAWNMFPFHVDCLREFTLNFRARKKVDSAVYAPLEQLEKSGMRAVVLWGLT